MNFRKSEFPLFPHKLFRNTPNILEQGIPIGLTDPWARRDEWRYHKFFSARNRFLHIFPGLGIGTFCFGLYVVYDQFIAEKEAASH